MIPFDVETQSAVDLKLVGGRIYSAHPTTRILAMAWDDGGLKVWLPVAPAGSHPVERVQSMIRAKVYLQPEPPEDLLTNPGPFVAHNCTLFDELIWRRFLPPPRDGFVDSLPLARAAGLPGKLEDIAKRLVGRGKDSGKAAMHKLRHQFDLPPTLSQLAQIANYNVDDVQLLSLILDRIRDVNVETDLLRVDRKINERGIFVDRGLIEQILALSQEAQLRAEEEISRLTAGELDNSLRRPAILTKWLSKHGVRLPNLRKETIEQLLDDDDGTVPAVVLNVLALRTAATRITPHKMLKLLSHVSGDSRLRDSFVYWGAHTGRWTGRAVQIQNLPRGTHTYDQVAVTGLTYQSVSTVAQQTGCMVDDVLSSLVRPCFTAPAGKTLLIADYSAIECRGVAWFAEEGKLLSIFHNQGDVYLDMATRLFGRKITKADDIERQIGKTVVLGCGYGMGAPKLEAGCVAKGMCLERAGTSAEACVKGFREQYSQIPRLWWGYDKAARTTVETGDTVFEGRCWFARWGDHLIIELPSGRQLIYRNARIEMRRPKWDNADPRPTVVYNGPRGESHLYGGKITENVVQAACRDLLAAALLRLDSEGFDVVAHVHDEIIVESDSESQLQRMLELMTTPPDWASGFPIGAEGAARSRYTKGKSTSRAYNGRILT